MKRIFSSAKPLATTITLLGSLWSHVPNAFDWVDIISHAHSAVVIEEERAQ